MITSNGFSRLEYIKKINPIEKEIASELALLRGIEQSGINARSRIELLRRDLGVLNQHLAIIRTREEATDHDHT